MSRWLARRVRINGWKNERTDLPSREVEISLIVFVKRCSSGDLCSALRHAINHFAIISSAFVRRASNVNSCTSKRSPEIPVLNSSSRRDVFLASIWRYTRRYCHLPSEDSFRCNVSSRNEFERLLVSINLFPRSLLRFKILLHL